MAQPFDAVMRDRCLPPNHQVVYVSRVGNARLRCEQDRVEHQGVGQWQRGKHCCVPLGRGRQPGVESRGSRAGVAQVLHPVQRPSLRRQGFRAAAEEHGDLRVVSDCLQPAHWDFGDGAVGVCDGRQPTVPGAAERDPRRRRVGREPADVVQRDNLARGERSVGLVYICRFLEQYSPSVCGVHCPELSGGSPHAVRIVARGNGCVAELIDVHRRACHYVVSRVPSRPVGGHAPGVAGDALQERLILQVLLVEPVREREGVAAGGHVAGVVHVVVFVAVGLRWAVVLADAAHQFGLESVRREPQVGQDGAQFIDSELVWADGIHWQVCCALNI